MSGLLGISLEKSMHKMQLKIQRVIKQLLSFPWPNAHNPNPGVNPIKPILASLHQKWTQQAKFYLELHQF